MRRRLWLAIMLMTLTVLCLVSSAWAADEPAVRTRTWFEAFIWPGGGAIGVMLLLMNVASVAFIMQHFLSIRRANLLPQIEMEQIRTMFEQKQYREVIEFTAAQPSFLSYVVHSALNEAAHGYAAMERGMEEAIEERTTKLLRKVEILNVFGNIGPMLGLLGTVYGMIRTFNAIVKAGGIPVPAQLADSIGIALVTTFWGLIVAIPALGAYAWLRNSIDGLSAEVALTSQDLVSVFRPGGEKRPSAAPGAAVKV